MSETSTVVSLQEVGVRLADGRRIVSGLDFEIRSGEILVLLGRSGSGKTTTLKLINGLILPSEGRVVVDGRATSDWDRTRLRRRVGYVIQEIGLFPHFTVSRNVGVVPTLDGWEEDRKDRRVRELLATVGLDPDDFGGRYPSQLSGGQRQRVGVARALAADPPLLLLDEPFGALDPLTRLELQKELKALQDRLTKTMVFVTHDIREAMFLGSRIALFQDGRIVFLGTTDEFFESEHEEARAFAEALGGPRSPAGQGEGG